MNSGWVFGFVLYLSYLLGVPAFLVKALLMPTPSPQWIGMRY